MPDVVLVTFSAGAAGPWRIDRTTAVVGAGLPSATSLSIVEGSTAATGGDWQLRGAVSHPRYATSAEVGRLTSVSPPLGRSEATCAALIPIRKSATWWSLAQDARRAIFEEQSQHIARSMRFLPAVARRLHHSRDLGEPFDFLTWFEFAPGDTAAFDELLRELRSSEEWRYVDREIDIRLTRTH